MNAKVEARLTASKAADKKQDSIITSYATIVKFNGSIYDGDPAKSVVWLKDDVDGTYFRALCLEIGPVENLHVKYGYHILNPGDKMVLDWDKSTLPSLPDYTGSTFLPNHGEDHTWPDGKPGKDVVLFYPRAYTVLQTRVADGVRVHLSPLMLVYDGEIRYFKGHHYLNLSTYIPDVNLFRFVIVGLNIKTMEPQVVSGSTANFNQFKYPPFPAIVSDFIPSALILLRSDTETLYERDIISDLRQLINIPLNATIQSDDVIKMRVFS